MTINSSQLKYILDNTPSSQNIMLVGKHGIGKSRILEEYFAEKGAKVVTLFLGQMSDPGDLIGLPEKNEKTGKTDFMLPYWFPLDDEPVVLFLDELNRARPEVLQTIMDLTLNRKLAGKTLPKGSRIISAVNHGNEYQLTDLDPALVSRFNIYEFEPTVEDWILWAQERGIDSRIISFISENPEYLDGSDIDASHSNLERTPDRRSWERTSEIIENFAELGELQKPIISGILGNRAAAVFFRFVMENDIPSAQEILAGHYDDASIKLGKLNSQNLSQVNISLFRYLENKIPHSNESEKKSFSENILKYFNFLGSSGKRELQSHFASLCSAEKYPETLNFIASEAGAFYDSLMQLVMSL